MNKTAIKNFAIWARNKLIADIQYRAGLMGITADGIKDPLPQSTGTMEFYDIGTSEPYAISGEAIPQRKKLVEVIRKKEKDSDYATAYKYILEEVAYTWFNRLIAIRFMEVNDYLPSHIRVLSSESGKIEPDLVTTPFDAELAFTSAEEETVLRLKTENNLDELFRLLFIKQCNALNEILPALFEKTSDYTELLLNLSVVDQEGVVYHLTHDIPEQDFDITHPDEDGEVKGQVEIIGWLYQYYNTEPKNAAFAKNGKITKEEIPAVTQLFTPDWIVRYMVENSLGRIFIDKRKEQGVYADGRGLDEMSWDEVEAKRIANEKEIAGQMGWKYYLPEAAQIKEVRQQLEEIQKQSEYKDVRDIKVIDPCMGSGHILVYAFDVLMQMYENDGYSQRDAAQCILEHNLFGLDIDERAAQLAYFAVMMKARQYDRRIFSRGIQPHVYAVAESNDIDAYTRDYFTNNDPKLKAALVSIMNDLRDAKEYGSILTVAPVDFAALYARVEEVQNDISLYRESALNTIFPLIRVAQVLAQQYDVVVTNPPYMGSSNMDVRLSEFVKKHYPDSKNDLFAVFIERCGQMTGKNRYQAMITQHAWMFLSSFEKLRAKLLLKDTVNMAHLGPRAFEEIGGEVVQTTSFVLRNSHIADYKGTYCRLIEPTTQQGKEEMFLAGENRYTAQQSNFSKIPGSPVAYWVSGSFIQAFVNGVSLNSIAPTRKGMFTGDNDKWLKFWHEIDYRDLFFKQKPYNKGGEFRRWYGNHEYVINWNNNGQSVINFKGSGNINTTLYFRPCITWSLVTTYKPSFRGIFDNDHVMGDAGPIAAAKENDILYLLGLLNTKFVAEVAALIAPTINFSNGVAGDIPVLFDNLNRPKIEALAQENVKISQADWDSYETSWDFQRHPLIRSVSRLTDAYAAWKDECEQRFLQLKTNEEELNRIFIVIYGLQDELTPDVADKDVTVHRVFDTKDDVPQSMQGSNYVRTKRDEIVSLLSYAVGCMFGRYSVDVDGLAYAGGDWDDGKYKTFLPDRDGILPITDEEYLEDDIISRLCDWLKAAYGADTLEENLDFIAGALGGKGNSSREIIRNYFLKDFFKDHCKTYQKRPIYWLFDSGKQNGFKALIYLHRYTPDTIGNLRVDYLHKMQRVYESEINRMQDMIDHSTNAREVAASTKRKEKLQKQLKECRDYDEMIAHLALSRIELDLDDGVKVNYEKIQTASDGKKYAVLAKI
ncbi:MAG: BREX-1 system adenine-specific DNA-methyltransferase PglX [Mediterraneibacter sp.]